MKTILFRENEIPCYINWLDDVTFVFWFGEEIFTDSKGDNYFIHFEYHLAEKESVIEIFWEEDSALLNDIKNSDEYITADEIENIKSIAEKEMKDRQNSDFIRG